MILALYVSRLSVLNFVSEDSQDRQLARWKLNEEEINTSHEIN